MKRKGEKTMPINELRENDLKDIIINLHLDYERDYWRLHYDFKKWAEYGEAIKKNVLNETRGLYSRAERNIEYLDIMLARYKEIGFVETEEFRMWMQTEKDFYEKELGRLKPLKSLLPLVKPLAQLNRKGGQ